MTILDFPRPRLRPLHVDEAESNARIAQQSLNRLLPHIEGLCKLTSASEANEIRDAYATARGAVSMIVNGLEGAKK